MENNKSGITGNKYFLQAYAGITFQHGGIGNLDAEKILVQEGFQAITLPQERSFHIYLKRWLAMRAVVHRLKAGDIVVCQFPVYPRMYQLLIRKLARKGIKLIAILADIDGLKDNNPVLLKKEIQQYCLFQNFIVHNDAMESWLKSKVEHINVVQLGPFDFLATPRVSPRTMEHGINFSGNLSKSSFLKDLNQLQQIQFHVYGAKGDLSFSWPSNLIFYGVFQPYALPEIIQGSYGLIWDGESIHTAAGALGHYMEYINHHKLSLYILSGLPVIAPAFAGSASYITEMGIGWLVQDMSEIPALLDKITLSEYQAAREKMIPIALEISRGNHLKNALKKIFNS